MEDYGKELSRLITNTEGRVTSYKKLMGAAHKNGDRLLVRLFKALKQEEEKVLKCLRQEKQDWNSGLWFNPKSQYQQPYDPEDKIEKILDEMEQ